MRAEEGDLGPLRGGRHGLSREQVVESQRERLLAAVAELIAERGFDGTPIAEIAKRAGVANRVFYANFGGKDEAFLAAFDAIADHLGRRIAEAAARGEEWPDRVIAGLRAAVEFFDAEPTVARFCLVAPFTTTRRITEHCRDRISVAEPYLAEGRAFLDGERLPPGTEDSLLGGTVAQLSRALRGGLPLPDLLPALIEFLLTPYLGQAEARRRALAATA